MSKSELSSLLENLQVFDVSDADIESDFSLQGLTNSGEKLTYHFSQEGDEHYVLREDLGVRFKLPKATAQKLRGVELQALAVE